MGLELGWAALFKSPPQLKTKSPSGEVSYPGYARQRVVHDGKTTLVTINFPSCPPGKFVLASHAVLFNDADIVIGVQPLGGFK